MLAFEIRGWELVIADLRPKCSPGSRRARKTTEISPTALRARAATRVPPERILRISRRPARKLVSLNPIRDTLEDFFVRRVAEVGEGRASPRKAGPDAGD